MAGDEPGPSTLPLPMGLHPKAPSKKQCSETGRQEQGLTCSPVMETRLDSTVGRLGRRGDECGDVTGE